MADPDRVQRRLGQCEQLLLGGGVHVARQEAPPPAEGRRMAKLARGRQVPHPAVLGQQFDSDIVGEGTAVAAIAQVLLDNEAAFVCSESRDEFHEFLGVVGPGGRRAAGAAPRLDDRRVRHSVGQGL